MIDCSSPSDCPDPPIGSTPATDECAPCGTVTQETLLSAINGLRAKNCELTSRLANWHSLLDKARNRLVALEQRMSLLETPDAPAQSVSINLCSLDEVEELEGVAGCFGGNGGLLMLDDCETIVGKDGKAVKSKVGAFLLPASVTLITNVYTTNQVVSMAAYEDDIPQCAKFALCHVAMTGSSLTSSASLYLKAHFPSGEMHQVAGIFSWSESSGFSGVVLVPILDGPQLKFDVTTSGYESKALTVKLLGFL